MTEKKQARCIVVGAGYVGLATAAALARTWDGEVTVIDQNLDRVVDHLEMMEIGQDPLGEPRMREALRPVNGPGRVEFGSAHEVTFELANWYRDSVVFVCVGTPYLLTERGNATIDCAAVREVVHQALDQGARLVVIRSTVTPSFVRELLAEVRDGGPSAVDRVVVAPEFLREGHAVHDTLHPSRIVVGAHVRAVAESVYAMLAEPPAKMSLPGTPCHLVRPEEAALVKLSSNAMLSFRAWFAGAVAESCEGIPGGDALQVLEAIGADPRIGKAHLRPGLGVGGPCLGKDASALLDDQDAFGRFRSIAEGMEEDPVIRLVDRIRAARKGPGLTLILGAGFKPDSTDWRDSPAVELAIQLSADGPVVLCEWRITNEDRERLRKYLEDTVQGDRLPSVVANLSDLREIEVVIAVAKCDVLVEEIEGVLADDALIVDPYRILNRNGRGIREGERRYLGTGLGPT